jgi:hypothetical protein
MLLNIHTKGKIVNISVGDGRQTFRWLALVITERFKEFRVLKNSFEEDCRLIISLKDSEGRLLNPLDPICEVLSNGADIFCDIVDSIPSDEFGNPIQSDWRIAAYVRNSNGIKWNREMEIWREQSKLSSDNDVQSSALVLVGSFTANDIDAAFDIDWRLMDWKWLGYSSSDKEVHELKNMLRSNYGPICKVFSHYCGPARGMYIYCMLHVLYM